MADIFFGTEVEPSAFEIAVQQIFLSGLQERVKATGDLSSSVNTALGFKTGQDGSLVPLTEQERFDSLSPVEQQTFSLFKQQASRLEDAFAGEPSEKLKQRSKQQFDILKEEQARRGQPLAGSNLETGVGFSTPAIQSLGESQRTQGLLEDTEQRNEIAQGFGNIFNTAGILDKFNTQRITNLSNAPQRFDIGGGGGLLANAGAASRITQKQQGNINQEIFDLGAGILGII